MGRIFKAQYWIRLSNGNIKQNNEIEFTFPEDITTASLYSEEKKNGRVSNIIGNLTGYSSHQIEIRKLEDLGNKSTEQRTSEYNSEKARKEQIKREIAQQKKDDADLDDYLDRIQNKYGSGKRKKEEDSFIGSIFSSEEKQDTRTPEQIEADRVRVAEENRKFFESIKRNWKIILAGIIVAFIITGVMGYLNSQKVKEANELNLKLEKIEDQIKLAITDGNRDKALELVDQLVHPLHEKWEADDKFDAWNGYPYYDEWWSKKRQEYKEQVMSMVSKGNVSNQANTTPRIDFKNLRLYYDFLKTKGADLPPTYENFESTLMDESKAKQYYEYLSQNNFDRPESFDVFYENIANYSNLNNASTQDTQASNLSTEKKYYNGCGYSYESKEDCMEQCAAFNGGKCPEGEATGKIVKASK